MSYIDKIKSVGKFLGYDNKNREVYECFYYKGRIIVKLSKDTTDNTYYDFAEYQEYIKGSLIEPMLFTLSNPKEVWEIIIRPEPEYIIYSHRYYGKSKLSKPKELKGIKSIGNATFIPKRCKPQIYLKDNDIWIKHTDYFSSSWRPPEGERIDMPLNYYLGTYFNTVRNKKFIYADNWGSIVLRDEAWILLKDYLTLALTENHVIFAKNVLNKQRIDKYTPYMTDDNENNWSRFWEDVCKVIKMYQRRKLITNCYN
jgi:hypothetical protein